MSDTSQGGEAEEARRRAGEEAQTQERKARRKGVDRKPKQKARRQDGHGDTQPAEQIRTSYRLDLLRRLFPKSVAEPIPPPPLIVHPGLRALRIAIPLFPHPCVASREHPHMFRPETVAHVRTIVLKLGVVGHSRGIAASLRRWPLGPHVSQRIAGHKDLLRPRGAPRVPANLEKHQVTPYQAIFGSRMYLPIYETPAEKTADRSKLDRIIPSMGKVRQEVLLTLKL